MIKQSKYKNICTTWGRNRETLIKYYIKPDTEYGISIFSRVKNTDIKDQKS